VITRVVILFILLSGCSVLDTNSFQFQSCLKIYCDSSEDSKVKSAGLKIVSIAAESQGIKLELDRGFCSKYYDNRAPANGYVYLKKSAYDVCKGVE